MIVWYDRSFAVMTERNVSVRFVFPNMAHGPAIVQAVPTPAIGHICWNVGINLDERRKGQDQTAQSCGCCHHCASSDRMAGLDMFLDIIHERPFISLSDSDYCVI